MKISLPTSGTWSHPIERIHLLPFSPPPGAPVALDPSITLPSRRESERQRLRSLRRTGLLDSPQEERFDRLTRDAQSYFGVQTVIISFISEDRQFLKSFVGDLPRTIPRDLALCDTTIKQDGLLLIPDMRIDPRFSTHPFVVGEPFARFYAGIPLRGPSGWFVGSLCLVDTEPRHLCARERAYLGTLADLAEIEVNAGA